ncbi:thioesterase superfamily protein [Maritalea porphyrae]|uniref:Thioesterase superfamily protein n=2 Tax=Maritalea porphyrae TaxID=880732 RepID=A0ABQ5URC0_9HYPH|nr:thioesterase superfamily protein [Maritalea porphyrae]
MQPAVVNFKERVMKSFQKQTACASIGLKLSNVEAGEALFTLPFNSNFTQQHGFMHAGIITTALDTACGYAAFSLMPEDAAVLSIEFKTNLLRPAIGERFLILGKVIKPGRNINFCEATATAIDAHGAETKVATMSASIMAVYDRAISD